MGCVRVLVDSELNVGFGDSDEGVSMRNHFEALERRNVLAAGVTGAIVVDVLPTPVEVQHAHTSSPKSRQASAMPPKPGRERNEPPEKPTFEFDLNPTKVRRPLFSGELICCP
jgi:hypothetical protein